MTQRWAIRFEVGDPAQLDAAVASLGRLRLLERTKVFLSSDSLWVGGPHSKESSAAVLCSLPCADRFVVNSDGTLTKFGERTPSGTIPDVEWTSLRDFVEPQLPVAGISPVRIARIPVTLVRNTGQEPVEPTALLVPAAAAAEWAATAPQIRLNPLTFVASSDGQILFRGAPLPSLPGIRLIDQEGVFVPAGWKWSPATDAGSLREALDVNADELVLLVQGDAFQRICPGDFVQVSRMAIHASVANL